MMISASSWAGRRDHAATSSSATPAEMAAAAVPTKAWSIRAAL
ncbi:hypothetical protein [Streptomyces sp. SP18BB07]|nr:hypothetical protein [Streptomyces sp. SP18BB07]MEE1761062.1 hypothetical protein [Streptomyces sp. SP18BB07]